MSEQQWHLDKRVPVAIIFAIFIQSMGGIWWASSLNERTAQIERRIEGFAQRSQAADREINTIQQSVAVLSAQLQNQIRATERLDTAVRETNQLLREAIERVNEEAPFRGGRP